MAKTLDQCDLNVELLTGDQVHLLEALGEHGLEVAFDIGGRTRFEQLGDALLKVLKKGLFVHVSPREVKRL